MKTWEKVLITVLALTAVVFAVKLILEIYDTKVKRNYIDVN